MQRLQRTRTFSRAILLAKASSLGMLSPLRVYVVCECVFVCAYARVKTIMLAKASSLDIGIPLCVYV